MHRMKASPSAKSNSLVHHNHTACLRKTTPRRDLLTSHHLNRHRCLVPQVRFQTHHLSFLPGKLLHRPPPHTLEPQDDGPSLHSSFRVLDPDSHLIRAMLQADLLPPHFPASYSTHQRVHNLKVEWLAHHSHQTRRWGVNQFLRGQVVIAEAGVNSSEGTASHHPAWD